MNSTNNENRNDTMNPISIRVKEAAKRYSISPSTVYNLMNREDFPLIYRIGGIITIPLAEYDKFMSGFLTSSHKPEV